MKVTKIKRTIGRKKNGKSAVKVAIGPKVSHGSGSDPGNQSDKLPSAAIWIESSS